VWYGWVQNWVDRGYWNGKRTEETRKKFEGIASRKYEDEERITMGFKVTPIWLCPCWHVLGVQIPSENIEWMGEEGCECEPDNQADYDDFLNL
jgi:hypothetical protein